MALRGSSRVGAATRERVGKLAREMGYQRNPAVSEVMSALRCSRQGQYRETLAWINSHPRSDYFTNRSIHSASFGQLLQDGATERANELGFAVDTLWTKAPGMTGRRLTSILHSRGIRGLIIPPLPFPRAHGHLPLDWSEFAVVVIGYSLAKPFFHCVVPHHRHNIQIVLRKLRHKGHRKIGLLLTSAGDDRMDNHFSSAFYLYQHGIATSHRVPILLSDRDSECAAWLAQHRPTAVVTWGMRHLKELDIKDPSYSKKLVVAVMGWNCLHDSAFAGLDEAPLRVGRAAAESLVARLRNNEVGIPEDAQTLLVRGNWMDGPLR